MTDNLSEFSEAIAALVAVAGEWLTAIRVGPNQHITGLVWEPDLLVTADQALPPRDSYTVVLSTGMLAAARPIRRDPLLNLALLRLEHPVEVAPMAAGTGVAVGSLVVALGADYDGSPTVRLTAVHRRARSADRGVVLDLADSRAEQGGLALDTAGAVLGMMSVAAGGHVTVVPNRTINAFVAEAALPAPIAAGARAAAEAPRPVRSPPRPVVRPAAGPPPLAPPLAAPDVAPAFPSAQSAVRAPIPPRSDERRAWLGVALQPITVPEPLVPRAGQSSGRLVVSISAGGPAEQAGLRVGDVLLSVNGHSTSGPNALRTFLDGSRVGSQVEARVLRDTTVSTAWLTIADRP